MAQLEVIISGGFQGPYSQMLPAFEEMTGIKVITKSGASQGSGPKTIKAQLAAGTTAVNHPPSCLVSVPELYKIHFSFG